MALKLESAVSATTPSSRSTSLGRHRRQGDPAGQIDVAERVQTERHAVQLEVLLQQPAVDHLRGSRPAGGPRRPAAFEPVRAHLQRALGDQLARAGQSDREQPGLLLRPGQVEAGEDVPHDSRRPLAVRVHVIKCLGSGPVSRIRLRAAAGPSPVRSAGRTSAPGSPRASSEPSVSGVSSVSASQAQLPTGITQRGSAAGPASRCRPRPSSAPGCRRRRPAPPG